MDYFDKFLQEPQPEEFNDDLAQNYPDEYWDIPQEDFGWEDRV